MTRKSAPECAARPGEWLVPVDLPARGDIPEDRSLNATRIDANATPSEVRQFLRYLMERPDVTPDGERLFATLAAERKTTARGWMIWQERMRQGQAVRYTVAAQLDCTPDELPSLPTSIQTLPRVKRLGPQACKLMIGQELVRLFQEMGEFEALSIVEPLVEIQKASWLGPFDAPVSLNQQIRLRELNGFRWDRVPSAIHAPTGALLGDVPHLVMSMPFKEAVRQRALYLMALEQWAEGRMTARERSFWRDLIYNTPWAIEIRIDPFTGLPYFRIRKGVMPKDR